MIGSSLSHFKITSKLGEGGMGEVYRAEDSKLGREVAIKVLPEVVANDPERLARFEREAKVLAALNHPHIAAIYQVEEADDKHFLVMELAQGQTLKERIEHGPLSESEALPIALQIAEALEAAHDQGIVHRDLKPANVVVDADGNVKVLDFGLAKALEGDSTSSVATALSMSPTLTAQMTGAGMILGTAAYMAPEQARGKSVDRRADVWAFGCVLFEMLSGSATYGGETVTDILGAIVHKEPEWKELPETIAEPVRALLKRCLDKDPRRRLQAIGEARLTLERYIANPEAFATAAPQVVTEVAPAAPLWQRALPWAIAAALAIGLGAAVWLGRTETRVLRATIPPPEETVFHLNPFDPGPAVLSPDGTRVAFSAQDVNGNVLLYVRSLDAVQAHVLTGTEGAQYPFWSPDGRFIGFFTKEDNTLKKIDATGGPPMTLTAAIDGKGGSWSQEGVIAFAPGPDTPIHRVPAAGGESTPVTEIDSERHNSHRQPRFLPDGKRFLFVARAPNADDSVVMVASIDGAETPREVVKTQTQAEPADDYLLFMRENTLMAQPFDAGTAELAGEAAPIAEGVVYDAASSIAVYSTSRTGMLTYQTGEVTTGVTIEWRDRAGRQVGTLGDPAPYRRALLSPDGTYAIAQILDMESTTHDLWLYEIERNLRTRFTFDPGDDIFPVWTPDGAAILFASNRGGKFGIYRKLIEGVGDPELLYESSLDLLPRAVSPDGRSLAFGQPGEETNLDIWILPLSAGGEAEILRQTEFLEFPDSFSPDGRWLLYFSDEAGSFHQYATPFPGPGRRWQVSTDPGGYGVWSPDGSEIVYHTFDGQLMAVGIEIRETGLRVGASEPLFPLPSPIAGGPHFSVSGDGERFLIVPRDSTQADTLLNLVVNWPQVLEER